MLPELWLRGGVVRNGVTVVHCTLLYVQSDTSYRVYVRGAVVLLCSNEILLDRLTV
jgi:hypothetical protein